MSGIQIPRGFYGMIYSVAILYCWIGMWRAFNSGQVLGGNRYVLVEIAVLILFMLWQARQIKDFRKEGIRDILNSKETNKIRKIAFSLCILTAVVVFLAVIVAHLIFWFGNEEWRVLVFEYSKGYMVYGKGGGMPTIPWLIIGLVCAAAFSIFCAAFVFVSLFMGTLFTGVSLTVALHNWFNGGVFDIGVFFQALFDLSISDALSYLIVIGQFILAQIVNYRGAGSSTPVLET